MKTLTVEQAASGLEQWLEKALAGEDIRIRKGDAMVELRPVSNCHSAQPLERLSPREVLRCLQRDAHLTPDQVQRYLVELDEERLAAEDWCGGSRSAVGVASY
jgi:hypothetical protein